MPPVSKRRRTSGPARTPSATSTSTPSASQKQGQSTLSFRASKAGAKAADVKKKGERLNDEVATKGVLDAAVPSASVVASAGTVTIPSPKEATRQEVEVDKVGGQAEVEEEEEEEDEEEKEMDAKALALPEARIKSYWAAKQAERKAPRVHQEGLAVREKVLREFDMSSRFGPSIGIPRLARWRRAHALGLQPPVEVLAVLLKEVQGASGVGGGKGKARREGGMVPQRSIMDELIMSSRGGEGGVEV